MREVLREEGFAALPRRLDEERPRAAAAHRRAGGRRARLLAGAAPRFYTQCGGLFLFAADLVRLICDAMADAAQLPGSKMIPAEHALRACLALKLWSIERKSHVMALVADQGLALFCGLNVMPKKSYLSRVLLAPRATGAPSSCSAPGTAQWPARRCSTPARSTWISTRCPTTASIRWSSATTSRRAAAASPACWSSWPRTPQGAAFCYSNADLRKGEEAEEIFRFIAFWEKYTSERPRHLVFDSRLTTYPNLARLDAHGHHLHHPASALTGTAARRSPPCRAGLAHRRARCAQRASTRPRASTNRKCNWPASTLRQLYVLDLGHDEPTILLTNDQRSSAAKLITRYAQRMLIENALSDAVRFFHIDALSSAVGLKVDFDMALLVIASGLYRLLAQRMRGYADAQARQIFRDLVDMPATVDVTEREITVSFHRRAHLPILMASDCSIDQCPCHGPIMRRYA